jgi:hypothetical protein
LETRYHKETRFPFLDKKAIFHEFDAWKRAADLQARGAFFDYLKLK